MSKRASRIAVIGLDCCLPNMIRKYIDEDAIPHIKKLTDNGFFAEDCLCPLPTITPPNWATIATGAWPGTHGITCFHYHIPGTNPDNSNIRQAWDSRRWQAEPIWKAADRAGKKSIVMTYPGAWPGDLEHGIIIGGEGFIPGDRREGIPGLSASFDVVQDFIVTTGYMPYSVRGTFDDAEGWKNLPDSLGDEPREMRFRLPAEGSREPVDTTWWVLAWRSDGDDYDRVTVCTEKDFSTALFTLKPGEWSAKVTTGVTMASGDRREVFFRAKLLELSDDAEDFRLLMGAMISTDGRWCSKPEYAPAMTAGDACLHRSGGLHMYLGGEAIDFETYLEMSLEVTRWLGQAVTGLMQAIPDWELFYMHSHPCDWFYHAAITDMASDDPAVRERAWAGHKRIYQGEDALVGAVMEAAGKDTLFAVVSDHGAVIDGPAFNPFDALLPAGLVTLKQNPAEGEEKNADQALVDRLVGLHTMELDWTKTRAVPQRETYIYINLKGRDPEGCVEPADYAAVQQEIIDALLAYRDPNMGNRRPVALALTKEDARILGLYGDRIGDVVYAINPEWGAQHGAILPTARYSVGELHSVLILSGPGIKKGFRLAKPCRLVDLVPTLCYATGFPVPADAEGAVLYPALRDPDAPHSEIARLKKSLDSLEAAMERGRRQPWEKHDCA